MQPGNTEELTRAAAKAINSVLGRMPGLNLLHTPGAKKTPLHEKCSAETAAKNIRQGRNYNPAAREYMARAISRVLGRNFEPVSISTKSKVTNFPTPTEAATTQLNN